MKNAILSCALGSLLTLGGAAQTQINRTRQHNLSINTHGEASSCADLKATSDGEIAQTVEHFDLSRGEAPTLELNAGDHGVVSVRGWKQSGYSLEACKMAAAGDRGTADMLVRGIALSHSAGRFSYTGPTGPANDSGTWQVYFIIHAPDSASLDLETKNAPVSIADVNGNIKVRATNGPLAIRGSSGNIDAQTTNGPISFDGDSGEVHLRAQNGPIAVKLQKEIWNGSTLEAHTVNGPMSLTMPAVFQSGLRVEASSGSPISCKHEACSRANTDWKGDQRVIQMNGSTQTVHITTENGPLSISEPKAPKKVL